MNGKRNAAEHRLQRTAASPLAGMRREPVKVLVGEGVLPAPPLPLKPAVMLQIQIAKSGTKDESAQE